MSDTSQGPGWWMASDGKWYPPELYPKDWEPPAHVAEALRAASGESAPDPGDEAAAQAAVAEPAAEIAAEPAVAEPAAEIAAEPVVAEPAAEIAAEPVVAETSVSSTDADDAVAAAETDSAQDQIAQPAAVAEDRPDAAAPEPADEGSTSGAAQAGAAVAAAGGDGVAQPAAYTPSEPVESPSYGSAEDITEPTSAPAEVVEPTEAAASTPPTDPPPATPPAAPPASPGVIEPPPGFGAEPTQVIAGAEAASAPSTAGAPADQTSVMEPVAPAPPAVPAVVPTAPTTTARTAPSIGVIIALVGAVAMIVGSLLEWAAPTVDANADVPQQLADLGFVADERLNIDAIGPLSTQSNSVGVLAAGVVALVAAALLAFVARHLLFKLVALVAALAGVGLAVFSFLDLSDLGVTVNGTELAGISFDISVGLWVALAGGVVAVIGALLAPTK